MREPDVPCARCRSHESNGGAVVVGSTRAAAIHGQRAWCQGDRLCSLDDGGSVRAVGVLGSFLFAITITAVAIGLIVIVAFFLIGRVGVDDAIAAFRGSADFLIGIANLVGGAVGVFGTSQFADAGTADSHEILAAWSTWVPTIGTRCAEGSEVRRGFADGREADFARGTVRTRLPLETSPSANSLVAQRASLTATIAQRSGAASAHERPARWNTCAAVADSTDGTRAIDEFIAYAPLIRANASDVAQGAAKMVLVGSSSVTTRVELSPEHGLTDTLTLRTLENLANPDKGVKQVK